MYTFKHPSNPLVLDQAKICPIWLPGDVIALGICSCWFHDIKNGPSSIRLSTCSTCPPSRVESFVVFTNPQEYTLGKISYYNQWLLGGSVQGSRKKSGVQACLDGIREIPPPWFKTILRERDERFIHRICPADGDFVILTHLFNFLAESSQVWMIRNEVFEKLDLEMTVASIARMEYHFSRLHGVVCDLQVFQKRIPQ